MKKRSLGKRIISKVLVPVTKTYLQKPRSAKLLGMILDVPPGVFHPTLYFSTRSMCRFLGTIDLKDKKLIEIGCGSGAVSIYAAKKEALVFCCDINPLAVSTTQLNALKNDVHITAFTSDLFEGTNEAGFDLIINNPPFYPKDPTNLEDNAWYAGKDHDYFKRFFFQSKKKLKIGGVIYMVLSSDCDLPTIKSIAQGFSFITKVEAIQQHFIEKTFILRFSIQDNL